MPILIEFSNLDDLLTDPGVFPIAEPIRLTVTEKTRLVLPFKEIVMTLDVRTVTPNGHVLSWHCLTSKIRYIGNEPDDYEKADIEAARGYSTRLYHQLRNYIADTVGMDPGAVRSGSINVDADRFLEGYLPDLTEYKEVTGEEKTS